ncbi:MAG: hypothetical protein A2201_02910 [Alicyclobacillus sp. RIFOXYA1_FULL_53_8]|nr:MAG: hypothetical protein A2201_02910 [Alicyclobacillus sp. RIFOXYA1_FULL_53_8]
MKKWTALSIVASMVLGLAVLHNQQANASPNPATSALRTATYLEKSFSATHATVTGYEMNNWSSLGSAQMSLTDLSRQASRFTQEFSLQDTKTYKYAATNELYYEVTGVGPQHTRVTATFTSFANPAGSLASGSAGASATGAVGSTAATAAAHSTAASSTVTSAYSVMTVRVDGQASSLTGFAPVMQKLATAIAAIHVVPQISACIEGSSNGTIVGDSVPRVVAQAFAAVGAHEVEGLTTNLVTSISGYSPEASTVILTNGHPMNLQVALHYDTLTHRTNVLVGTPIITVTY